MGFENCRQHAETAGHIDENGAMELKVHWMCSYVCPIVSRTENLMLGLVWNIYQRQTFDWPWRSWLLEFILNWFWLRFTMKYPTLFCSITWQTPEGGPAPSVHTVIKRSQGIYWGQMHTFIILTLSISGIIVQSAQSCKESIVFWM